MAGRTLDGHVRSPPLAWPQINRGMGWKSTGLGAETRFFSEGPLVKTMVDSFRDYHAPVSALKRVGPILPALPGSPNGPRDTGVTGQRSSLALQPGDLVGLDVCLNVCSTDA